MWSQREGGLSAITQVYPVRYLLQDGVNTVRYVLSNGVKVFSPEIYNIARGQGGRPKMLGGVVCSMLTPLDNVLSFISNGVENVFSPTTQASGFPWG